MNGLEKLSLAFEQASVRYAAANGIERSDDWFVLKLSEELGELTQAWMKLTARSRTHGKPQTELRTAVDDECADVLGHILLFAHRNGVDLAAAIERKWRFEPELG